MTRYTADEIRDLPTLCVGQCCNLKVDTGAVRVWLCRCGVDDGMPYDDQITVEVLNPKNFCWEEVEVYPG